MRIMLSITAAAALALGSSGIASAAPPASYCPDGQPKCERVSVNPGNALIICTGWREYGRPAGEPKPPFCPENMDTE